MKRRFLLFCGCCAGLQLGAAESSNSFAAAKTIFQTDRPYDPRMGVAADAAIVHRHGVGEDLPALAAALSTWQKKGYPTGRMFFADSDGANEYWSGKWDGVDHSGDIEQSAGGKRVVCAGVRPYMVPTPGWIGYLEAQTEKSLQAGATAILPEEPLGHVYAGYSEGFRQSWEQYYGFPWQAQQTSDLARFLTAQLKSKLFLDLETRLMETTRKHAAQTGVPVSFVIPIHSIYGNIAGQMVAPLGSSTAVAGVDGYIGQIWTGPVNWALRQYDSADKSFFGSAYALYDYFTQLTVGTDKKLWLLVDPVEDDPNHTWSEFSEWYRHCVSAMLLMPEVDSYEVMPWPDRIFLPGFAMGGGTPAPEDFRATLLAITQALQEMPLGGQWSLMDSVQPSTGIAVAIADSAMWQSATDDRLQGIYGLLMPLIEQGVPVSACVLERAGDESYMNRHKVIILSYENFKPVAPEMNVALAEWVKRGGVLVLLGESDDALDRSDYFWWNKAGASSPMHHLLDQLGGAHDRRIEWNCGKGHVLRNKIPSREFASPKAAAEVYLPLIDQAVKYAEPAGKLRTPGYFMMKRGPFVIAHARHKSISAEGKFIDIFDPRLPVVDGIRLSPGASGLFRDVSRMLAANGSPCVLHATHRLMCQNFDGGKLRFSIKGPAETPAVVRVFPGGREMEGMTAVASDGKNVEVVSVVEGSTVRLWFKNDPGGVDVEIACKR